jgi:hypothetical protein
MRSARAQRRKPHFSPPPPPPPPSKRAKFHLQRSRSIYKVDRQPLGFRGYQVARDLVQDLVASAFGNRKFKW